MRKVLPILLLAVMLIIGCSGKRMAKGPSDEVFVVASEAAREEVQTAIDSTFSFGIRGPAFQHYFLVKWQGLENLRECLYLPHTILVVDMNVPNAARQLVTDLLSEERLQSIQQDSVALFALPNVWQDVQVLIIAAGYDMEQLADFIIERQGWIFSKINEKYIERQSHFLFNQYEQKELPRKLGKQYGWTMRIPSDFQIVREYPKRNFVWLGRALPNRWISVSWQNGIQTEWLTANGLYLKREKIGRIYGQIRTEKRFLGHEFRKLGGRDALRMWGLWYDEMEPKGGPFMTYAFYDEVSDRSFVIDMMVFAPGEKTVNYLRQMEIMASTFRSVVKNN